MRNFRTGDLLWPKRKRTLAPQARSAETKPAEDRPAWEAQRDRMLADPAAAGLTPEVAERLRTMNYADFEREYFSLSSRELPPTEATPRGAGRGPISVGHVGLLEMQPTGHAFVIEAIPGLRGGASRGVVRLPYADWLRGYSNIQVWHGRLRNANARTGRNLLNVALAQLGKPYDFFNFDLNDDTGFYCSKLVWMCAWRAMSVAVDDDPDPRRGSRFPPWFSPKALIAARHIEMLHSPDEY